MSGSDPLAEYTVRDFSAVESQIQQNADREKVVTQKLESQITNKYAFWLAV